MIPAASLPQTSQSPSGALLSRPAVCELADFATLAVEGADAQTFLQGQLSSDVRRLAPGTWQHSTYNSPKGRVLANLMLWRDGDGYRALLPRELAEPVRKRLSMFVLRSKVAITDLTSSLAAWGIAGAGAEDIVRQAVGSVPQPRRVQAADGRRALALESSRWLIVAPGADDALAPLLAGGDRATPEFWRWLGIRAGIPLITLATQDQFVLQTANLDALGAVSFDKGCYTGQEIVARTQHLGRLKERLFAWHAQAESVAPGTRLYSPVFADQACGTVVNAAAAPGGGCDLLAVVQLAAAQSGDVRLGEAAGERLEALPLPYEMPEPRAPSRPKL